MKKIISSITIILFVVVGVKAQNIGVNQISPTHSLHISPVNIGDDPLRIDGVQAYSVGDTSLLMINTSTGIVKYINPVDFISIISGGAGLGTDDQNIDSLILNGLTLTTFIENGNSANVNLTPVSDSAISYIINNSDTLFSNSSFVDSIVGIVNTTTDTLFSNQSFIDSITTLLYNNADTLLSNSTFINSLRDSIDTDIDSVILVGSILTIYENGNSAFVDLSSLSDADSDPQNEIQDLNLTGNNLTITNHSSPSTINLSPYLDNTDAQTLSLSGNSLSISNGNNVDLSSFNGDITGVTAGVGLVGGGNNGALTINAAANNGITVNSGADRIQLGGALVQNTTITQGNFGMTYNLDGTGDFNVQDNGTTHFQIRDDGLSFFGDDTYWRDGNVGGTNLMVLTDDGDDGRLRIYENGATSVDLDANTQFIFNQQGLDRDFRIESSGNTNMLRVDASTNRVGIGSGTPTSTLDINGKTTTTNFQMTAGAPGNGKILTSDNVGNASWQASPVITPSVIGLKNSTNANEAIRNQNSSATWSRSSWQMTLPVGKWLVFFAAPVRETESPRNTDTYADLVVTLSDSPNSITRNNFSFIGGANKGREIVGQFSRGLFYIVTGSTPIDVTTNTTIYLGMDVQGTNFYGYNSGQGIYMQGAGEQRSYFYAIPIN